MPSFSRFIVALALAIQVALGPAQLMFGVCHGMIRLSVGDSDVHKCAERNEAIGSEEAPTGPLVEHNDCSECYDIDLAGSDQPLVASGSVELPTQLVLVGYVVPERLSKPTSWQFGARVARGPPCAKTPTGLLPGVFPLRI